MRCSAGGRRVRMPVAAASSSGGEVAMLVAMLKTMLHDYVQRRHSSHDVGDALSERDEDGSASMVAVRAPHRRYSDGPLTHWTGDHWASNWIGNQMRRGFFPGWCRLLGV